MSKVIRLTENDLMKIVKRVITEQNNRSSLKEYYVNPLLKQGYKVVAKVNLPDGDYTKYGGGYQIDLYSADKKTKTGYILITENGIRGMWSGEPTKLVGGTIPSERIYKILYKPVESSPTQSGTTQN